MCYDMRRFERLIKEKKRRKKEQELSFTIEDKPKILVNSRTKQIKKEKEK